MPDKGSVNCLDPGLHYRDVGTYCMCVKGAGSLARPGPYHISFRGLAVELQQPWGSLCLCDFYTYSVCVAAERPAFYSETTRAPYLSTNASKLHPFPR